MLCIHNKEVCIIWNRMRVIKMKKVLQNRKCL